MHNYVLKIHSAYWVRIFPQTTPLIRKQNRNTTKDGWKDGKIPLGSGSFLSAFNQFYLYAKSGKRSGKKKKNKALLDAKTLNLLTGKWLHAAT